MSDRPPTILSPHGEGYCRYCRFVVGLGADGLMDQHYYNRGQVADATKPCKGSLRIPPKVTPYASKLAMFKVTAQKITCPGCGKPTVVGWHDMIAQHEVPGWSREMCKASFQRWVRATG